MAHSRLIVLVLIVMSAFASSADALIEGPGVYYGLELPEAFYNYWNYTSDIKDMHRLYMYKNFAAAAKIHVQGKNNKRNETAYRIMNDFTYRNLSLEGPQSFWGVYSKHFNSMQYLKDLIDPPLYGNGSYAGACCGVRAAALDVYMRLWQVAYAQHEVDIGIALVAAEEASHGFAVVSSPVDEPSNYWNRVEAYAKLACIKPVKDPITQNLYAATNIKYRDGFAEMGPAIDIEDLDQRSVEIAKIRAKLEREILVQHMQVLMVESKRASQIGHFKMKKTTCYKECSKGTPFQSGAQAAWTAIQPFAARSTDKATITNISNMLKSPASSWNRKVFFPAFSAEVGKLAASLGVNFAAEIWACKW